MKILHITNEFTKKNFSISSLILYISNFLFKRYHLDFSILTTTSDDNLFTKKNIDILNLNSWAGYFNNKKNLIEKINSHNVIHIHGLWAPIQFISIIICIKDKKSCFVHPHGMLLNEAIKSGGLIKLIFKKVSLFFLKLIMDNNIKFISITNQETEAINKYFPNTNVTEISNPIPFDIQLKEKKIKKKTMVYFGRIHPHKNIDLMIEAFLKANLGSEWSLKIYGIRDDEKYYSKLQKKINDFTNIEIKKPVFGVEKQNIMQEAWINILVSKSEVLSLSILESSVHGLPSLVNNNIETFGLENAVHKTKINLETLSKKILEISNWTLNERIQKGQNIFEKIKDKTSMEIISLKYDGLYKKIEIENELQKKVITDFSIFGLFKKDFNFLLMSSTYTFNLMFASFLVVALVVLGHFSVAGELGLMTSFWITFTQIFSSNMRSIVVSEQNRNYALITMAYRVFFSSGMLFIFYLASSIIFEFENQKLINVISILIMTQWINEMSLVQYEIKNKIKIFKIFSFLNLIIILASGLSIYFLKFEYLSNIILLYSLTIFLSFYRNLLDSLKKIVNTSLKIISDLNLKTIAFLSSFSIIISSFAWRIIIYYIFDKSLAGVFFASFSIGSFPGTLFNSVIGPSFIKQKIKISYNLKKLLLILFLFVLLSFLYSSYLLYSNSNIDYLGRDFIIFTISASVIGSFFMSYAMFLRHKKIQDSLEVRILLFRRDVLYGLSITFLIPILYFIGNTIAVSFSFLLAAVIAMATYTYNYKDKKNIPDI